jgi:hypothetical protein
VDPSALIAAIDEAAQSVGETAVPRTAAALYGIDVAVWVGAMNALEAAADGRRIIERYAWVLVGLFSTATVAGNALVAGTEPVDPRMVHALGDSWAHCVSQLAHAAPAVTMILFAHLAVYWSEGGRGSTSRRSSAATSRNSKRSSTRRGAPSPPWVPPGQLRPPLSAAGNHDQERRPAAWWWPSADRAHRHDSHHGGAVPPIAQPPTDGVAPGHSRGPALTAAEARRATVRLVRRARAAGQEVSTEDVQRTTGRSARQARRLLALAVIEGVAEDSRTAATVGEIP